MRTLKHGNKIAKAVEQAFYYRLYIFTLLYDYHRNISQPTTNQKYISTTTTAGNKKIIIKTGFAFSNKMMKKNYIFVHEINHKTSCNIQLRMRHEQTCQLRIRIAHVVIYRLCMHTILQLHDRSVCMIARVQCSRANRARRFAPGHFVCECAHYWPLGRLYTFYRGFSHRRGWR
jgi:hypothetical protein